MQERTPKLLRLPLLTVVLLGVATACGGGAGPPANPPKIAPVRPTVEKAPPVASAAPKK
jgi:hypothetical protein